MTIHSVGFSLNRLSSPYNSSWKRLFSNWLTHFDTLSMYHLYDIANVTDKLNHRKYDYNTQNLIVIKKQTYVSSSYSLAIEKLGKKDAFKWSIVRFLQRDFYPLLCIRRTTTTRRRCLPLAWYETYSSAAFLFGQKRK